ncbi:MAG: dipeptide/oligopeptide/nickel ABC transporter ATP-binding protein [Mesoaciditoga sp.]|uniref:ABC transporter ATP-binding protein n=1 Tax=Athalassotoga sp. TaxID=2022597 RepID=UPI000CB85102|nr:MAG: dipeptide/oligopeptide/nickel ABC transporter ATP-binding protein [Mesoaciditoga sp.]HEU24212.1 ABC transporter ATP-binding protein [Mesoaciditoga lauensis]
MSLLEARDLSIEYLTRDGNLKAVENVSFSLGFHETLGLVGESGCGKSTIGLSLLRILPINARMKGKILYKEKDIAILPEEEIRSLRGKEISMIFQDPMTSLDPIMRIKNQFFETFRAHFQKMKEEEMIKISSDVLKSIGIDPSRLENYPFEFSGGMRQRVMIALAIVLNPSLLIADEPTTSLDVVVQLQIMEVLKELKDKRNMSMVLITHDLGLVAEIVDKVGIMYAGNLVEFGDVNSIYENPLHPYTRLLLISIPNVKLEDMELKYIKGNLPSLKSPPAGCKFHPRCPFVMDVCTKEDPPTFEINERKVKCWLYEGEHDESKSETNIG